MANFSSIFKGILGGNRGKESKRLNFFASMGPFRVQVETGLGETKSMQEKFPYGLSTHFSLCSFNKSAMTLLIG